MKMLANSPEDMRGRSVTSLGRTESVGRQGSVPVADMARTAVPKIKLSELCRRLYTAVHVIL